MTVDVEDYFQVSAFEPVIGRHTWDGYERRVAANTTRLLELFGAAGVRATFFVLGWVAEREPALLRAIAAAGHELASHGHAHRLVYEQSPEAFREDLHRARLAIEQAAGVHVRGYRAPSFSVTARSRWALDVLVEEGYAYDASIYPIRHDRYGWPEALRHPHVIRARAGALIEAPGTTVRLGPVSMPAAGGGYFRLFPYWWTRWAIARVNGRDRQPAIVYVHPWEIDPGQPRVAASRASRFRHYVNLDRTEHRLGRLLRDFRFGPLADVLEGMHLLPSAAGGRP